MFEIEFANSDTGKMHNYMISFNFDKGPFLYFVRTWGGSENDHLTLCTEIFLMYGGGRVQKIQNTLT